MKSRKRSRGIYLLGILLAVVLLALDQWTKWLAVRHLKGQEDISLIPGVLKLHYLENHGAAFGILQNQQWLFALLTVAILAAVVYVVVRMPARPRYYPMYVLAFTLIAGALGNFYDRLVNRYVVDFIYFCLIDFPIFNLADIYVTCSMIVFLPFFFFYYREEDFGFLKTR